MRDGIWKGLPLPREWRSVLRSCVREAERGETAQAKLAHALARALLGVAPAFIRRLQDRAHDQGPALPGLADAASLGATSVLEGAVAARFVRLEAAGHRGDGLVQEALAQAGRQCLEAHVRHIRQFCQREAGAEAGAVAAALAAAEAAVDVHAAAAARIAGDRPPRAAPRRPVSLEEDLTEAP